MQDLKVTLVQTDIHWEQINANLAMLEEKIWKDNPDTDLIVLPEMFNTGFTMNGQAVAEPMNGNTCKWMKQVASQTGAYICGSIVIKEEGRFYNRFIFVSPEGKYQWYDKRHLYRMAGEDTVYTAGKEKIIVKIKGYRISPLVCYDLRFPVWSRRTVEESGDYDVLIYVASWPAPRISSWTILLKARAVENLCYTVGVNRIGTDGSNLEYTGESIVCGPKGEVLASMENFNAIQTVSIPGSQIREFREKFPVHLDADRFQILD
jgi:omega-amidase